MKKTFIVEVEYEELDKDRVFYDMALEVCVDDLLYGYAQTKAIKEDYSVEVKQI